MCRGHRKLILTKNVKSKCLIILVAILTIHSQKSDKSESQPNYVSSVNDRFSDLGSEMGPEYPDESGFLRDGLFSAQSRKENEDVLMDERNNARDYPIPVRDPQWPLYKLAIGEAAGVSVDSKGAPYILHRGNRKWEYGTFDGPHFAHKDKGPIVENVLIKLDPKDGKIVQSHFSNTFYMPHGLTIDPHDNIWVTDVAMHQVFKYDKGNFSSPSLVLGEKFVPGSDGYHFCQPTDVAVGSNGDFFVSDGYCNHRIIKYSSKGDLIAIVGKSVPGLWYDPALAFSLPHGMTLLEQADMLCVADREAYRVVCLRAGVVKLPGQVDTGFLDLFKLYSERQPEDQPAFLTYSIVDLNDNGIRPYALANLYPTNNLYIITQPNEPRNGRNPTDYSASGRTFRVNYKLQIDTTWFSFPIKTKFENMTKPYLKLNHHFEPGCSDSSSDLSMAERTQKGLGRSWQSSSRPHDITIFNSTNLYVADLDMGIWKFVIHFPNE